LTSGILDAQHALQPLDLSLASTLGAWTGWLVRPWGGGGGARARGLARAGWSSGFSRS